jgi:hypothetical protein
MSGVLGLVLYYQLNQLRHLFVIVSAGAAWPQFIVQPGESALLIAPAPVANGRSTHPAAPRHFPIGLSVARPQYDAGGRTSECGMLRERTIDCSCRRSASLIVNPLFGLPIPATSPATLADAVARVKLSMGHYTRTLH